MTMLALDEDFGADLDRIVLVEHYPHVTAKAPCLGPTMHRFCAVAGIPPDVYLDCFDRAALRAECPPAFDAASARDAAATLLTVCESRLVVCFGLIVSSYCDANIPLLEWHQVDSVEIDGCEGAGPDAIAVIPCGITGVWWQRSDHRELVAHFLQECVEIVYARRNA
jgi:hypothetical protein